MRRWTAIFSGVLVAAIAALVVIALRVPRHDYREAELRRDQQRLEDGMNDCRHRCVAVAAESFQYGPMTGCSCGGTLP